MRSNGEGKRGGGEGGGWGGVWGSEGREVEYTGNGDTGEVGMEILISRLTHSTGAQVC